MRSWIAVVALAFAGAMLAWPPDAFSRRSERASYSVPVVISAADPVRDTVASPAPEQAAIDRPVPTAELASRYAARVDRPFLGGGHSAAPSPEELMLAELERRAPGSIPALVGLLATGWDREAVISLLVELGDAALPDVLEASRSGPELARSRAVRVLGGFASRHPELIAVVSAKLNESATAEAAAHALLNFGEPALPLLIAEVERRGATATALMSLASFGSAARAATPQAIEVLESGDKDERWAAVWAIGKIATDSPAVVRALVNALEDPEIAGAHAATVLARFGRTDVLVAALPDAGADARRRIADALVELDDKAVAPLEAVFVDLAVDSDPWVRLDAADVLTRLDRRPDLTVPILRAALGTDQPYRALQAARVTARLGRSGRLGQSGATLIPRILDAYGRAAGTFFLEEPLLAALLALGRHDPDAIAAGERHPSERVRDVSRRVHRAIRDG